MGWVFKLYIHISGVMCRCSLIVLMSAIVNAAKAIF